MPEAALVRRVFSTISGRYDMANTVISFGMATRWRRNVARMVAARKPADVLDLATGSGDLAFEMRRRLPDSTSILGLDFCEPMLERARAKQARRPAMGGIEFRQGDATALNLPAASFDVVTIAWGLRNLENRQAGLREMLRVLRPGGALLCLEFSQPYAWLRRPYYLYMNHVLPRVARIVTGDKAAYDYLAGTVSQFPDRESLAAEMRAAGFATVTAHAQIGSIIAIHEAVKSS